jgi:hypothetical protein
MKKENEDLSRRIFMQGLGLGSIALGSYALGRQDQDTPQALQGLAADDLPRDANGNVIPGFGPEPTEDPDSTVTQDRVAKQWEPVSDRKVKVGIAGYGLCRFGASFFTKTIPT